MRPGEAARLGARYGFEAWAAYAVAECLFSSVLPWALPLAAPTYASSDAFTLFITAAYLVFGAVSGAGSGVILYFAGRHWPWLRGIPASRVLSTTAQLAVALALTFFAVYSPEAMPIALAAVWVVLIVLTAASRKWEGRIGALASPWTACFVLLGFQWLDKGAIVDWPWWRPVTAYAVCAAAVLLAAAGHRKFGRRSPLRWAAGTLAAVLAAAFAVDQPVTTANAGTAAAPAAERPNVILITLDTVRADHLSLYGHARSTTPNLERLAHDSVVYTGAISAGDMTLSTHASIFTGLYPSRHGAHTTLERPWGTPLAALAAKLPSLPELLLQHGYRTSAVVANHAYLAAAFGFARGFERYDSRSAARFLAPSLKFYLRARVRNLLTHFVPRWAFEASTRSADAINREVFTALDELRRDPRPFFLFVNYMDAHWPYVPPPPYDSLYPGKAPRFTNSQYFSLEEDLLAGRRDATPAELSHLESQYDGALTYLDAEVGRLVQRLKQTGLYDKTLLVITSDHGEALGERSMVGHGLSVYQDQVHVPLLIKFPSGDPAMQAGTRVEGPVSSVDLLPTIMETLGFSTPPGLQGRSLRALEPSQELSHTIFAESFPSLRLVNLQAKLNRIERAAFSGSMKLIRSTAGKHELYDLAQDPRERKNVYAALGSAAHPLEAVLAKWVQVAGATKTRPSAVDPGTIEKLRSLGYVQ